MKGFAFLKGQPVSNYILSNGRRNSFSKRYSQGSRSLQSFAQILHLFSAVRILATSLRYRMQNDYKHLFSIMVHRWLPRHSTLLENSVSQKMISLNSCTINGVILAVALLSSSSSSSSARTASPVNERRNLDDDKINA